MNAAIFLLPSKTRTVLQEADRKLVPYAITSINNKPMVEITTNGITTPFAPEELSAIILQKMKSTAEAFLGEEVKDAVISVPAYFNNDQRKATRVSLSNMYRAIM